VDIDGESRWLIGVTLITDYDFPIDVTIQLNNVGGPSAGMMFALGIMDRIGSDPRRLLAGMLAATAFISMWISNTATAAMMMPIGLAVVLQVEDQRGRGGFGGGGMGGPVVVGGGGIGIIILIISLLLGVNPLSDYSSTANPSIDGAPSVQDCQTGADANKRDDCRIVGFVDSIQKYWTDEFARRGDTYLPAKTVLFTDATQGACGMAQTAMGPFYCPEDEKVYLDISFFEELTQRFGAKGGPFAQGYVVAHEYGHHVQDLQGTIGRAQQGVQGAQGNSVRTELQADCYAGIWAHYAAVTKQPGTDVTYLEPLSDKDIADALSAASSVGDDRIQKEATGRINPEQWTHGSSAERQKWFTVGYQTGDIKKCDTFATDNLG